MPHKGTKPYVAAALAAFAAALASLGSAHSAAALATLAAALGSAHLAAALKDSKGKHKKPKKKGKK